MLAWPHSLSTRTATHGKINNRNGSTTIYFFFIRNKSTPIVYNKPLVIYPKLGILGLVDDGQPEVFVALVLAVWVYGVHQSDCIYGVVGYCASGLMRAKMIMFL